MKIGDEVLLKAKVVGLACGSQGSMTLVEVAGCCEASEYGRDQGDKEIKFLKFWVGGLNQLSAIAE